MERAKKLPISIGQYTIVDTHKIAGGYGGTLVKGRVVHGEFEQKRQKEGETSTKIVENLRGQGVKESIKSQNRQDFQKIFEVCGGNSQSKIAYGLRGSDESRVALVQMLQEINTLNKAAKSCAKNNPRYDIGVFRTGGGLFDNETYPDGTVYAIALEPGSESAQLQAIKIFTMKYIVGKSKRVSMARIVPRGSNHIWSMSVRDYAAMYKRADKINGIEIRK